eukprot:GHUV01034009.1.p2 GENE.GHUV01034009.1~~GHUV01034009.1.p2  ORF type:complete len:108 (-),score=13.14 GHUV01034009.1:878-1201(-)
MSQRTDTATTKLKASHHGCTALFFLAIAYVTEVCRMSGGSMGDKIVEADKLLSKANKYWAPSLLDFRLKPDWEAAAPLFEKAAMLYKVRPLLYSHAWSIRRGTDSWY